MRGRGRGGGGDGGESGDVLRGTSSLAYGQEYVRVGLHAATDILLVAMVPEEGSSLVYHNEMGCLVQFSRMSREVTGTEVCLRVTSVKSAKESSLGVGSGWWEGTVQVGSHEEDIGTAAA